MDSLCGTCKYAEFDYNEKGYFPDGCKKDYPEHSENKWNEVIECEGYKEAKLEEDDGCR